MNRLTFTALRLGGGLDVERIFRLLHLPGAPVLGLRLQ